MNLRDLFLRVRALAAPRRAERELDEELAFHLEREAQKHLAAGMSPDDARTRALARFGSVSRVADHCRDVRGTGVVEALVNDVIYAFRTFRRAPLPALTIVATVGLGLGMVSVVFTIYNTIYLRADAVRRPGELFAVRRSAGSGADIPQAFTRREYDALRRESGVFSGAIALLRPVPTRLEGRRVTSDLVSGNFFDVLGVQPILGRPLRPADDSLTTGHRVIVLSHRGWNRLFASDPTAIGRRVRINGLPYEIVGVMPEDFRGLGILAPDYWAPLALVGTFRSAYVGRENDVPIDVVGRLKPGMSPRAAAAGLTSWVSRRTDVQGVTRGPVSIRLTPSKGTLVANLETLMAFSPLFFAFGLILMIGCANVANLLFARGVSRQREFGVRLSLGASRQRIVRQLLTESLLLALASAAVGLAVSRLSLELALRAITTMLPPTILELDLARWTPEADWRVLLFLVAGAILATAFFGLAPALQTTRLELVRTMRGEMTRDARPGRARHALIVVQVGASALLLICAVVFLRGAMAAATTDPGVRTSDTVVVAVANESRRAALLQALRTHPSVAAVAASAPASAAGASTAVSARAMNAQGELSTSVVQMAVSPDYFDVLQIDVVEGRRFTASERTVESAVVVVSETAARRLWPDRDAVGQVLRLEPAASDSTDVLAPPERAFTVIGVAKDVGGGLQIPDLFAFRGVYLPSSPETAGTSLTIRVRGDPEQARQDLIESLTAVEPGLGAINTMQTIAGLQTYVMGIAFWVTVILGGLALTLTLSGLFSVLSYIVEQRAKDIGVRMALGATTGHIARLVVSQSIRPVGIGLVAGGGLASALATVLMSTPAAAAIRGVVHVFDPVAYATSLLIIVACCMVAASLPALRAARIDPIVTLRRE